MNEAVLNVYQQRANEFRSQKDTLGRRLLLNSLLRLVFFVLFGWFLYAAFRERFSGNALLYSIGGFIIFLYWVSRAGILKQKIGFAEKLILINDNEITVLKGGSSCFEDGGTTQIVPGFVTDLNVLGKHSLYHHLNRTGSISGRKQLAKAITDPLLSPQQIIDYQACVKELSGKTAFRQNLQAHTLLLKEEVSLSQMITGLPEGAGSGLEKSPWKQLSWIWPIAGVLVITYAVWIQAYSYIFMFALLGLLVLSPALRQVSQLYQHISRKGYLFTQYATCFQLICEEKLVHPVLREKQQQIAEAAEAFRKLSRLMGVFDLRVSLLTFFVNGLFLSDLLCARAYLQWNRKYQSSFNKWFDTLGEIEMLSSLACFHQNHPGFVFPEVAAGCTAINATGLGHPLMDTRKAVTNDFSIGTTARLHLVTGSNMSGKSTFLRSVGLNMLLAQMGAPVFAERFSFSPVRLLTSFHHIDSLEESTSYFYAELKCLQSIMHALEGQTPALVLLDEVMRGTNSMDKHDGTALLIKKLLQKNCLTLIATHDTELGILAEQYPGQVENYCFESEVTETGLHFDFTRKAGIAQSRNATYLMKQMGIV